MAKKTVKKSTKTSTSKAIQATGNLKEQTQEQPIPEELPPINAEIKWVDNIYVAKRDNPAVVYLNFQTIVPAGKHRFQGEVAKIMMPMETVCLLIETLQRMVEDE